MLRFGILASVLPLLLTGGLVREWFPTEMLPCISGGVADVQVTRSANLSARSVSFATEPKDATIRVQIVDTPEMADLALVDDGTGGEEASCRAGADLRRIRITSEAVPGEPRIYLSREAGDYRIYLASTRMSLQEAAALIVAARSGQERLTAAALRALPHGERAAH